MNTVVLIASLLGGVVQGIPQISTEIKSIIAGIVGSLSAVVSSGVTTGISPTTVLTALSGVITALQSVQGLSPTTLQAIKDLENAAAAAYAADQQAQQKVDPTQLQPIAPVA